MSRLAAIRPRVPSALRVLAATGAVGGLVWYAGAHPLALDLVSAGGAEEAPVVGTSLMTATTAMCPGNELSGIAGVTDADVGGVLSAATAPGDLLPTSPGGRGAARLLAGSAPLASVSAARPGSAEAALPDAGPVTLSATGILAPAITATQEWAVATKDVRGLTTTPCLTARTDAWLLAGGTGAGRQEHLVLLNPGGNPVTAEVTVHGSTGQVGDTHTETVPAGGRTTVLLDAWAPGEARPAVHVVADGGGLASTLTDTWVVGSSPRGAETVTPAATGTVEVVPAAVIRPGSVLRVANTGDDEAVVRVDVLGRGGLVETTSDTVLTVAAGAVGEVPLQVATPGAYAVAVRADVPVAAAVSTTSGGTAGAPSDLAWSGSAPALADVAGAALPRTPGADRTLQLVSTGGASTVSVTSVVGGEPVERTLSLVADRTTPVPLDDATAVWVQRVDGSGALRGGITTTLNTGTASEVLSVLTLEPSAVRSPVSRAFPLP